ncbi:RNA polymerase II mediator complex subunit [Arthrobotrys conoides]|uniref:Mediator of RNA polymerase II transcription subunit 17 n=1 Tax=Arthrobotrys conoides TaxID=74498 RepID=A0AAN8P763_9PEZI
MDEHLLLSLTSWPDPDPQITSLSSLIPRIQSERGPFKNVTEDSLNEEIAAAEKLPDHDATHEDDQTPLPATADDQPNPRETLALRKQELIKLIEHAQFDAMSALDFVSLLLSSVRPTHAEASMSRHLRDSISSGTLGSDSIRKKDSTQSEKADSETISKGWRSESLVQSASSLFNAASRLTQESEREQMYWEDVLDVKREGWAICRVPREPQSLGVRFGFSEAGADEKYRGLGVLRKGTDGAITMQDLLGHGTLARGSVRVRVSRDGQLTGTSEPFEDVIHTSGITSMIQNSRNYAYEHELFLEIAREARTLANLGFRNVDEAVTFELGTNSTVIIDMMSNADIPAAETTSDQDNELAQGLSTALRLLLSHAHRQNLKKRRLPPSLLTQRLIANPPLNLLRPIVSHLRHKSNTDEFKTSASNLIGYAKSAGLSAHLTLENCHNCLSRDINNAEDAVDSLTGLLESKATLYLPGSWKIVVLIQTLLGPSVFGTRFAVHTSHDGSCATLLGANSFSSQAEVQRYLQWCLERSVINYIAGRITEWEQIAMSNEMTKAGQQTQYKRLRVEVENEHLAVRWTIGGGEDENHTWTGEEGALSLEALIMSI